jgi:hypothetical protein
MASSSVEQPVTPSPDGIRDMDATSAEDTALVRARRRQDHGDYSDDDDNMALMSSIEGRLDSFATREENDEYFTLDQDQPFALESASPSAMVEDEEQDTAALPAVSVNTALTTSLAELSSEPTDLYRREARSVEDYYSAYGGNGTMTGKVRVPSRHEQKSSALASGGDDEDVDDTAIQYRDDARQQQHGEMMTTHVLPHHLATTPAFRLKRAPGMEVIDLLDSSSDDDDEDKQAETSALTEIMVDEALQQRLLAHDHQKRLKLAADAATGSSYSRRKTLVLAPHRAPWTADPIRAPSSAVAGALASYHAREAHLPVWMKGATATNSSGSSSHQAGRAITPGASLSSSNHGSGALQSALRGGAPAPRRRYAFDPRRYPISGTPRMEAMPSYQQKQQEPSHSSPILKVDVPYPLLYPAGFTPTWNKILPDVIPPAVPPLQSERKAFRLSLLNVGEFTIVGLPVTTDGPPTSIAGLRAPIRAISRDHGKAVYEQKSAARDPDGGGSKWRIPLGAYQAFFAYLKESHPNAIVEGIPMHQLQIASLERARQVKGYPSIEELIQRGMPAGLANALAPFQRGGVDFVLSKGGRALIADGKKLFVCNGLVCPCVTVLSVLVRFPVWMLCVSLSP